MSTMDSGVATSAPRIPKRPVRRPVIRPGEISATIASTRSAISSKSTRSSRFWDSVSCTMAIEPTLRTASPSASLPCSESILRACRRSSAATVWRLFFTRWWISRMVASLVINSRSRRRTSVMSRSRMSEPIRVPLGLSGMARSWTMQSLASTSAPRGAPSRWPA